MSQHVLEAAERGAGDAMTVNEWGRVSAILGRRVLEVMPDADAADDARRVRETRTVVVDNDPRARFITGDSEARAAAATQRERYVHPAPERVGHETARRVREAAERPVDPDAWREAARRAGVDPSVWRGDAA